jgi:hypothetical protein
MLNLLKLLTDGRLFLSMFMFSFAAGDAGLGGGDADPAAVIAGAAEGDGAADIDPDAAAADADPNAVIDPDAAPETDKPVQQQAAPQPDGRQVPAAVRKHLAALKATGKPEDIALAKQINDAVWGYSALKADIAKNFGPEGLKEAIALKSTVEELTGADSIDQFKEEVQQFRQLDQQFINGDPEFIKTAVAQFPDGFKKLMPHMLDTWAQTDPDSYDRRMAGIIVATLNQNQFGNNLARAVDFLEMQDPDKSNHVIQKVIALLGDGQKALAGWAKFASEKPPAPQVDPNAEKNAQEARKLEADKQKFFLQGINKDLNTFSDNRITKELTQLKKTVPESARPVFNQQVIDTVWAKMRAESNFAVKYRAYVANKDHAGLLQFLQSRSDAHYTDAVDSTYKRLYGTTKFAGQKKADPVPGTKPGANGAVNNGQKPAAGWVKMANVDPAQIDRKLTSERDIVIGKKAVLKDGKKVYWGEKIPT